MDERIYTCPRCPSTTFRRRIHVNVIEWQQVDATGDVYDVNHTEHETDGSEVLSLACDACGFQGDPGDFQRHLQEASDAD